MNLKELKQKNKELVRCPNCGKLAAKGNFCEHCALKMVKTCKCCHAGTAKEQYCNGKYCPGYEAYFKYGLDLEAARLRQLPLSLKASGMLRLLYFRLRLEVELFPKLMKHNAHYLKVNLERIFSEFISVSHWLYQFSQEANWIRLYILISKDMARRIHDNI